MTPADINPGLWLIAAGLLAAATPWHPVRAILGVAAPLGALALLFGPGGMGAHGAIEFLGYQLLTHRFDATALPFATALVLGSLLAGLYAVGRTTRIESGAGLVLAGGAVGAVLSGDIVSFLLFFEIAILAGAALVWAGGGRLSAHAAIRFLAIHILAGSLLVAGAAAIAAADPFPVLGPVDPASAGGTLLLVGLAIRAGAPGLHVWLRDSQARTSPEGGVHLGAVITTVAIYGLLRGFAGEPMLIAIGLLTALWPLLFVAIEDDLRRVGCWGVLAHAGLMMAVAGVGGPLAAGAVMSMAFGGIIAFSLFFMAAGAVQARLGHCRISLLGRVWRTMPVSAALMLVAGLGIGAVPLTAGYTGLAVASGTMAQTQAPVVWVIFVLAAAAAGLAVGVRAPLRAFFATRVGAEPEEAPFPMILAMTLAGFFVMAAGLAPGFLEAMLPEGIRISAFVDDSRGEIAQIWIFAALVLAAFGMVRLDPRVRPGVARDLDDLYRGPARAALRWSTGTVQRIVGRMLEVGRAWSAELAASLAQAVRPGGLLVRWFEAPGAAWPLLVVAALVVTLIVLS
jgi:multicomponent Na+:H+ antiporter subunit D